MSDSLVQPRRQFLGQLIAGVAAASWDRWRLPELRADEDDVAQKLIVRQEKPFNAEPPLDRLRDRWLTEYGTFFQRSHGSVPEIDPGDYRLTVEGLVERPLSLSLGELREKFPEVFAAVTLTCAGNRRSEFRGEKKITGVQWAAGAISTAEWTGVKLSDVLQHAGVKAEAKHVWLDGLDEVKDGDKRFEFGGSIPIDKAMTGTQFTPGALLVHAMNKQPLPKEHGAPLRAVVPGYIGARSVKWLGKITVSDRPSPNHYVADVYKIVKEGTDAEVQATSPIYEHVLNSMICRWSKSDDAQKIQVAGIALPSGLPGCLIRRVELSVDDGQTWTAARIASAQREFCWTFWDAELPAAALGKTVLTRATDTQGTTQPREMPFNLKGYQFNGWHRAELKA